MTFKEKWLKPIVGLTILVVFLIPVLSVNLIHKHPGIIGWVLTGLFLGYVLSRGRFGFAGPIKKVVQQGDGRQAKALILLFMITSVICAAVLFGISQLGGKTSWLGDVGPLTLGTFIGGFIFGIGMVLATGCASGTLTDMGDGLAPAIFVLIFFMFGSVIGVGVWQNNSPAKLLLLNAHQASMPSMIGIGAGLIINLILLIIIFGGATLWHKYKESKGTLILTPLEEDAVEVGDADVSSFNIKKYFTYDFYMRVMAKRWKWTATVFGLALWYGITVAAFREGPGITGAYAKWGIAIFHGLGMKNALNWKPYVKFDFATDPQTWQNIAIIIGALSANLLSNRFKIIDYKGQKWYNWLLFAIGGTLMGFGARAANGCNFGALWTGVTNMTLYGWVFGIFLTIGAGAGSVFIRKLRHNTPGVVLDYDAKCKLKIKKKL